MELLHADLDGKVAAPGSTRIREGVRMKLRTPRTVTIPRLCGVGTPADEARDDVLAYFDRELASRGWLSGGGSSGIRTTDEVDARACHKDDRVIRVGVFRLPLPARDIETDARLTYYEVALIGEKV
jgi:hypothetical protein